MNDGNAIERRAKTACMLLLSAWLVWGAIQWIVVPIARAAIPYVDWTMASTYWWLVSIVPLAACVVGGTVIWFWAGIEQLIKNE